MNKNARLTEIDLLRFLAAFSVLIYHYTMQFPNLAGFTTYGRLGVNLFFIISGFVIMMTAIGRSPKEFVISRMVRLYPAFWACCTITFLVAFFWGTGDARVSVQKYLVNMTMLHGFFNIGHVDVVYWTLFVEMKFYLLVFILLFIKQMHRIEYYLGMWLIISMVGFEYFVDPLNAVFITKYSSYFIAGATFYLVYKNGLNFYRAAVLAGSFIFGICHYFLFFYTKTDPVDAFLNIQVFIWIDVVFYLVFLLIAFHKTRLIRSDFYISLGVLTYPLYLLHSHIWTVITTNPRLQVNDPYLLLFGMTAGMLLLAYLVHVLVEKNLAPVLKAWLEKRMVKGGT